MFWWSLGLITLGYYPYKKPFYALLIGFLSLMLMYILNGLIDPMLLFSGFIFKIIFISTFITGLIKIKKAEKIKELPDK